MSYNQKFITAYRETAVILGYLQHDPQTVILKSSEDYKNLMLAVGIPAHKLTVFTENTWEAGEVPAKIRETIQENMELGTLIRKQSSHETPTVAWVGDEKRLAPADVVLNGELWSLKNNSQILKNGGSFRLMNILLNSSEHKRGYHLLYELTQQEHSNYVKYAHRAYLDSLGAIDEVSTEDWISWKKLSKAKQKEVARFIASHRGQGTTISKELSSHKRIINNVAATKLTELLQHLDYDSIKAGELLGGDKAYYLASTGAGKVTLGRIPLSDEISEQVKLVKVHAEDGEQLDIMLTFRNKRNEELIIQCEIRYSHGQLVGVPECKMKVRGDTSLVDFLLIPLEA